MNLTKQQALSVGSVFTLISIFEFSLTSAYLYGLIGGLGIAFLLYSFTLKKEE